MSDTHTGTILYSKGIHALDWIAQPLSLEDLETFAHQMQPYTGAMMEEITFSVTRPINLQGTAIDTVNSVTVSARILMRDTDTGDLIGVNVIDPPLAIFEIIPNEGKRVKPANGEEVTAFFAQLTGRNLRYDDGWMVGE